jgi:hypothetical protein
MSTGRYLDLHKVYSTAIDVHRAIPKPARHMPPTESLYPVNERIPAFRIPAAPSKARHELPNTSDT